MSYEQSASVYDAIYTQMKDYRAETARVKELIGRNLLVKLYKRQPIHLLDVACGTGLHLQHYDERYRVEGIDLSAAQLAVAQRRLPNTNFGCLDMRDFDLGRRFHAVTCLFSAVGHLLTFADYQAAINRMAAHLERGGVLIVEGWLTPEMWRDDHWSQDLVDTPELKVDRMTWSRRDGRTTYLEMHHLVGTPDGAQYFVEHHTTVMRTVDEQLAAFQAAGLEARFDPEGLSANGRGLLIGVKPL